MNTLIQLEVECRLCGDSTTFNVEQWQIDELAKPRSERMFMQDIFPDMPIGDRELLISNTCDNCWKQLFGSDCEEEEE